jgi:hypothetical protein
MFGAEFVFINAATGLAARETGWPSRWPTADR